MPRNSAHSPPTAGLPLLGALLAAACPGPSADSPDTATQTATACVVDCDDSGDPLPTTDVFHNWIARGVRPLTQRDAWFDEAWTTYAADEGFLADPIDMDADPVELAGDNLWVRSFPALSGAVGAGVFAAIGEDVGLDAFRQVLRDISTAHANQAIDTETLERELHCRSGSPRVRPLFRRFVYGKADPPADPPAGYCDPVGP